LIAAALLDRLFIACNNINMPPAVPVFPFQ